MHVVTVGLSHKTAPVEIREKLAFSETELGETLHLLLGHPHVSEAVILSTCNRTEVYALSEDPVDGEAAVVDFLCRHRGLDGATLRPYLYCHHSDAAVHHLFRVSASLDSMVVGEAQVLGQVKEAYSYALECEATNVVFNRLFSHALGVGKLVRTETEIGGNAVSISYAAVELAKRVFENLEGHTVMIVGAGKMSELTATHLVANGISSVLVANRTYERAVELAERFSGRAVPFDELADYLVQADIVISSTGSPEFILNRDMVASVMHRRRNRPIFLIDIAVPRDIDPEVNRVNNAFLYDIDDLEQVVDANVGERQKEARKAELIVDREVREFLRWMAGLEVVPTVAELKKRAERIRLEETEKALAKLSELGEREKNLVKALSTVLTNRLLHEPVVRLKKSSGRKDGYVYVESMRHLFGLDEGVDEGTDEVTETGAADGAPGEAEEPGEAAAPCAAGGGEGPGVPSEPVAKEG